MIKALLEEKGLLSTQLENEIEHAMDDAACKTLTREIFHLLTTWYFSNFKKDHRADVQSDIGQILTSEILSPLVLWPPQISQILAPLNWQILTSGKYWSL